MTDRRAQQPERFAQNSGRSARPHASQELYGAAAQPRTASMPLPAVIAAVRGAALGRDDRYAGTQVPYAAPQNGDSPEASGHTHLNQVRLLADGRLFTGLMARDLDLVDEIGSLPDAIRTAAALAGIEGRPRVVSLREVPRLDLLDLLEGYALKRLGLGGSPGRSWDCGYRYLWLPAGGASAE